MFVQKASTSYFMIDSTQYVSMYINLNAERNLSFIFTTSSLITQALI